METEIYKLKDLAEHLTFRFKQISALYLFGSRRYRSGSQRSDIDVLVKTSNHIRPGDLRHFSLEFCPALDLFIADGGKAISCANESLVQANSFEQLVQDLNAVQFWTKNEGLKDADIPWEIAVPVGIDFPMTAMITGQPIPFKWPYSMAHYARLIEEQGLSSMPYIGHSAQGAAEFLIDVLRRLPECITSFNSRGKVWRVGFDTEYDFQNLFYLTVKPWLPGLGREEVTIRYDGAEKTADFNLFGNQIVIEIKHIRDTNTEASVIKTLHGLKTFYILHPNVRILLFAILVNKSVHIDIAKWENDFSYKMNEPVVRTVLILNPLK